MAWLRIDDCFTSNSKIGQLTDAEFRCWMRLLCHCAKTQDPTVGAVQVREVATLTWKRVERFAEVGLLDDTGGGHVVHDWVLYSDAPVSEKVAHYLGRHPDATANEVVKAVASKREIVLAEVRRIRETTPPPNGSREPESVVPKVVHARVLPSRPVLKDSSPSAVELGDQPRASRDRNSTGKNDHDQEPGPLADNVRALQETLARRRGAA